MAASRFVWHDLMTTDVERSKAFYTALFGWTTSHVEMGAYGAYTMITNGVMDIGGILPVDRRLGARSLWISYVNVPSVERTAAQASSLGAKVLVPASEIPNVGRYVILQDPEGAIMSPFTRHGGDNPEPDEPPPAGAFSWDELHTTDPSAASPFYCALFRWRARPVDMGLFGLYTMLRRSEKDTAGVAARDAGPLGGPVWLPYVAVDAVDDVTANVGKLGGTVLYRPADAPKFGRFAILRDPMGATLGLYTPLAAGS